jgi:hypothetical protein
MPLTQNQIGNAEKNNLNNGALIAKVYNIQCSFFLEAYHSDCFFFSYFLRHVFV